MPTGVLPAKSVIALPAVAVPVKVGVVISVMRSLLLTPLSLDVDKIGADGVAMACVGIAARSLTNKFAIGDPRPVTRS